MMRFPWLQTDRSTVPTMAGADTISQERIVPMSFDIFIAAMQANANSDFKISNVMNRL
ncbi:hypothetical protein [Achromobacter aloeverae]|uniref:hypothetical protein n=1 Tax=Achromobacter aloeverae TaxID=1750518 RepID=UPI0013015FBC|nr:hypothetical protein [Achromobacter aloeverae]